MKIYLAPLEGITGNIYRTNLHKHFGGIDKFFTPFISPAAEGALGTKAYRDVLPANNIGQRLVPQILTDSAEGFLVMCKRLNADFGYEEFNLNLGCPSGTVMSKGRGAAFLARTDDLDRFLDDIFKSRFKISLKTRIGKTDPEEFYKILEIYNKYPVYELIIHPRTGKDKYGNVPNRAMYRYAVENTKHKLCYNGDIFKYGDMLDFAAEFPGTECIMAGRGVISNPALPLIIKGGEMPENSKIMAFYKDVFNDYSEILYGSANLLHKMKELVLYMAKNFDDCPKTVKRIKKAKTPAEFDAAVTELFTACGPMRY